MNIMRLLRILLLFVVGAALGVGAGLYLGWAVWPTEYTDASPAVLQEAYQRDYAQMVADVYEVEGDLTAAQNRLAALGPDAEQRLLDFIADAVLAEANEADVRRLVRLAADLGLSLPFMP